ncbi:MAG: hypothetical protein GY859_14405 [Desulfobacterales bacterium]|nr:hypothetical protein [Desulfobacterales bacterium]
MIPELSVQGSQFIGGKLLPAFLYVNQRGVAGAKDPRQFHVCPGAADDIGLGMGRIYKVEFLKVFKQFRRGAILEP